MPARSNGAFLPLRPAAPLPGQGWTVRVIAHRDLLAYALGRNPPALAVISRYLSLSWSPENSDPGTGALTLSTTDPLWRYPLADGRRAAAIKDYDNLFVVYEAGQWRGEFFGRNVNETVLGAGESADRVVTISGPGSGDALARAVVMTPFYPKTPPKGVIGTYQFRNQPVMSGWITLLRAAQARGSATYVQVGFTGAHDSSGTAWEDTPPAKPKTTATATLAGDVLFPYDEFTLTDAGKAAVAAIVAKIAKVTYPAVTVVGHTDSTGSRDYNQTLSLNRAAAVADAIGALRTGCVFTIVGKGETQPVATNATAAGRARNRRVRVTYQARALATDTVWSPDPGTNLRDLLQSITNGSTATVRGPIHCEWVMRPRFYLQVRSQLGRDLSSSVVFHEGSTFLVSEGRERDRSDIANLVVVQSPLGVNKTASSRASRQRWGQREQFTRLESSYDDKIHALIAKTQLEAAKDETDSVTVMIAAGEGRTPFRDFGIGDWIGVSRLHGADPSTVVRQRVMAITVTVDAAGRPAYELKLDGVRASRARWLQAQIDSLINRKQGIRAFVQDDEPTGGTVGDLWTPLSDVE